MRRILTHHILPWVITGIALYYAFKGIDLDDLLTHLVEANPSWLLIALIATFVSYFLRAWRWHFFFPNTAMLAYSDAVRVLFLGFFMNNILPARAGEFVRAHLGSKISRSSRTLVLATIASERLVDGLTISLMFVICSAKVGDPEIAKNLLYVSGAFCMITLAVIIAILFRRAIFLLATAVHKRLNHSASAFTLERFQVFLNGLEPLCLPSRLPAIISLSAAIWLIELSVFYAISLAFGSALTFPLSVLFLAAVNFSSLIPSAPGGIGVIEVIASTILVSVGIPREQALTMVLCQHIIQYLVVGVPGAVVILTWKMRVRSLSKLAEESLAD